MNGPGAVEDNMFGHLDKISEEEGGGREDKKIEFQLEVDVDEKELDRDLEQ